MKLSYSDYKESLVAFIDILGATEFINSIDSEEKFNLAADFFLILKEQTDIWNAELTKKVDVRITSVSDSIIVSIPVLQQ